MKTLKELMKEYPDKTGEINLLFHDGKVRDCIVSPDFPGTAIQVERTVVFDLDTLDDDDVIIYEI